MALNIGGTLINNTRQLPADGSSAERAVRSGADLAKHYPNKPSGWYWIQSEKMPNALQMYVDMTEEGGGYDFYFITTGPSVNYVNVKNGGTPLGLDLVMPRSKFHWRAMSNAVRDQRPSGTYGDYFATTYGVYSVTPGNYTSVIMRSHIFYGTGSSSHQVKDLGRWWLRDTTFSEPNGDYPAYGLFGGYTQPAVNYALSDLQFNDISAAYSTGNYYLVSTNLKP
jgi:hypothetical protein